MVTEVLKHINELQVFDINSWLLLLRISSTQFAPWSCSLQALAATFGVVGKL